MEKLLTALIARRAEVSHEALARPAERSSFEYGRVSGVYQGLTAAIEALQDVLADKEEDE